MNRVWVVSYNHRFRQFKNGICWYRMSIRLRRWHRLGGVRVDLNGRMPRVSYLRPQGPKAPIGS